MDPIKKAMIEAMEKKAGIPANKSIANTTVENVLEKNGFRICGRFDKGNKWKNEQGTVLKCNDLVEIQSSTWPPKKDGEPVNTIYSLSGIWHKTEGNPDEENIAGKIKEELLSAFFKNIEREVQITIEVGFKLILQQ